MQIRPLAASLAVLALLPLTAQAQFGRLKEKVKQRAEQAVDKATDKALDKGEARVKCAISDKDCAAQAKAAGKDVELVADPAPSGSAVQAGEAAAAGKANAMKPGEGAWSNYDFVPGERVLFAEDFTRDRVGNFPKRLELLEGNAEVVEWNGGRWLKFESSDADNGFTINLPEALPQRFTIEMEMVIPWSGMYIIPAPAKPESFYEFTRAYIGGTDVGIMRAKSNEGSRLDPRSVFKDMHCESCYLSRPFKVRMHVDGRYVKLYLDERRVSNIPNAEFLRASKVHFLFGTTQFSGGQHAPLVKSISINAGGRELYEALAADGRVATQGIYFDTGSDRIRPESSGTLKEIADMLGEHPELKLVIEGHTDNVGDAAANQALSEKRAAAVKAALAGSYGVDAARLTSKGLGASKPVAKNETPEGRQQNRRVELVKG